jgi:hypothetical protein
MIVLLSSTAIKSEGFFVHDVGDEFILSVLLLCFGSSGQLLRLLLLSIFCCYELSDASLLPPAPFFDNLQ